MKVIREILAEAVEPCITCPGTGWITSGRGGRLWCVDCKGTGQMLTEDGHALVEFLMRWIGPKFAEADHGHSLH